MLGMLVKVLRGDSIATRRRLAREGNVAFEDLMRATSNFDVRTVTIKDLASVRYLLPITVGIITVKATMRSAWSHDTCRIDGEIGSLSNESISEPLPGGGGSIRRGPRQDVPRGHPSGRHGTILSPALAGKGRGGALMRDLCCYAVILRRRWMTRRFAGTGSFEKRDHERPDNSPT